MACNTAILGFALFDTTRVIIYVSFSSHLCFNFFTAQPTFALIYYLS